MPNQKDRKSRYLEPIWLTVTIALLILGIVSVAVLAFTDKWNSNRVSAFAAWATGLLTLAGIGLALYESASARREAEEIEARSAVDQARRNWEVERQRRIALEIQRRSEGMRYCADIMDTICEVSINFVDLVREAAFKFDDEQFRSARSLDASVMWMRAEPRIGARALPICDSTFAHVLAERTVPSLKMVFDRTDVIGSAESTDELLSLISEIDVALSASGEDLRKSAIDDFILNMDMVIEKVDKVFPPFREP
ncbi:hypothetical protein [Rhodococcus sp. NPDC127528]|uniref:hypothetical protein n=1 Tax=unclassified Rhodococcus (in: high G+C Gram-positive bacteria) TaxID=192944 RepID=UPI00363DD907